MTIGAIIVLVLIVWFFVWFIKKVNDESHGTVPGGRIESETGISIRKYPKYKPPNKWEMEKRAEEAERKKFYKEAEEKQLREIEEIERKWDERNAPDYAEYTKQNHFYDVKLQQWVKLLDNGDYVSSYDFYDWRIHGYKEPERPYKVTVRELITFPEYKPHEEFYRHNKRKFDENKDSSWTYEQYFWESLEEEEEDY